MVSITDVEVSRDLSHAKVFVTKLGLEKKEDAKETLAVLNRAGGFLRSQIAKDSTMRITPTLRFYFDESIFRGQSLSSLIDTARAKDREMSGESLLDAEQDEHEEPSAAGDDSDNA
jgi:ribosome-binding factor A